MSKRTNGEGNVRQLPSGAWNGRLSVVGDDGKLRTRSVTRPTKGEVLTELRNLKQNAESGKPVTETRQTFRSYFDHWESTTLPVAVRSVSTADQYRGLIRTHALPVLGGKRLSAITPSTIEALVHGLDRSPSTKRSLYAALRKLWTAAVRDGVTTRNPVLEVARPSVPKAVPKAPPVEDVRKLLKAARGTRQEPFVLLLATTGTRRGELLGCRWDDIEKADGGTYLNIRRTLVRASDGLKLRQPKTAAGVRRIPLPPVAVQALKRQRQIQREERLRAGSAWIDSGLLFTTPIGGAVEPRNASREYAELAKRAKVPAPGMHALRHYVATMLLDGGSSAREVADQLGHSSPSITLDIYAATVPESQRAAVERVARLLKGGE